MGLFLKKRVEMPDKMILGNTEFVFDRKLGFHVGEWTVWDRKTKILLEFQSTEGNIGDIVLEKVNWVNDHKDTIIRAFLDENDDCIDVVNEMIEDGTLEADGKISEDEFVKALFVNNVTIFVNGSETGFYIDLDAEPDYFMGHLVCIEVDCKLKLKSADSTDNTSNTKDKFCGRGNARNGIRKETSTYVNLERNPEQIGE